MVVLLTQELYFFLSSSSAAATAAAAASRSCILKPEAVNRSVSFKSISIVFLFPFPHNIGNRRRMSDDDVNLLRYCSDYTASYVRQSLRVTLRAKYWTPCSRRNDYIILSSWEQHSMAFSAVAQAAVASISSSMQLTELCTIEWRILTILISFSHLRTLTFTSPDVNVWRYHTVDLPHGGATVV